ncbi:MULTISPECIES: RNA polymerase sigma factor [Pedobacter]|uniref:RNA polymerase sigma factor, sigma-70 family n=1 Tax=Pedobacter heparinus (strain ATCC 13125 / DSM 2366 / CIP 104194 / JCM 7457 / NBRC 12017 / NCIMB 9290 / NRRL B-14731 / HIM 762-3) TaxID=485917 RepID=C6XXS3_PEDHD|nr:MULTISPECIES: sigma-70 family RNA polymerase sigma factor [Pedobacter]ACU04341.1 RNA polymerase sigma factor, sigma-70 family [Pedobacter heparinus DSM 2366]MBB5441033.1 RNA polymerase sigma-70 factor (ECF subfamily) [Pedobacter sp. AK017]
METYTSYSDQELISLFISGSDGAFKEIYLRYDKLLYLYAYHKLGNKEEARDMVHDVFAWMLNNREKLDLKTTLSGYLYKSVLNKIFNLFKHRQILKKYADAGNHYIDIESAETDFLIREKDVAAMIEKEIQAMPPRMREIYELKRNKHLSAKEIALQLDIAESTVTTQMKRAMKHLKLKLGLLVYLVFIIHP